jgi:hypothetical protein
VSERNVHTDPGSAREEAERLIAAVIAAVSSAGRSASRAGGGDGPLGPLGSLGALGDAVFSAAGHVGSAVRGATSDGAIATGSAECRVCPICRAIAALRDPGPEVAERLATGAGDLAAGVASLLRALGAAASATGSRPARSRRTAPAPPRPAGDDAVWRESTRRAQDSWPPESGEPDPWATATAAGPARPAPAVPATRTPMAKKAVRKTVVRKTVARGDVAKGDGAADGVAKGDGAADGVAKGDGAADGVAKGEPEWGSG